MSDQKSSGSESTAPADNAPAETPSAETAPATEFAFGTGRGPGLARGKRKPAKGAPAATSNAPVGDYQPTSVQIVTNASEYKNPFAPAEPEPAPAAPEPVATPEPVAKPAAATAPTPPEPKAAVAPAPEPVETSAPVKTAEAEESNEIPIC